jgi:hypothetical protein
MLGASTEKGRDLLGDSNFCLRILLKPTVKKRDMKVWATFTVMERSRSNPPPPQMENLVTSLINYQLLTKYYSTLSDYCLPQLNTGHAIYQVLLLVRQTVFAQATGLVFLVQNT